MTTNSLGTRKRLRARQWSCRRRPSEGTRLKQTNASSQAPAALREITRHWLLARLIVARGEVFGVITSTMVALYTQRKSSPLRTWTLSLSDVRPIQVPRCQP
jgi:hypothetical protein